MATTDTESIVASLIATLSARERRWLDKLFHAPATYETFTALENELYVGKDGAYSGSLLLASATRGEGRTTFALLLAVLSSAFDRSRRILLIDADSASARLTGMFTTTERRPGLREYAEGMATLDQCIATTAIPNLSFVPVAGQPGGHGRLSPIAFHRFMEGVRTRFDLILVDSPAAGGNRSILSLANIVGNVLIVVKYGGPTREQVATLNADLLRTNASVIGCVLNQREFVVPRFLYGSR